MSTPERELPSEPGSIIGWSLWYDGPLYGSAMLERDDESDELVWYRAGYEEAWTNDQIPNIWEYVGKITPCRHAYFTTQ